MVEMTMRWLKRKWDRFVKWLNEDDEPDYGGWL